MKRKYILHQARQIMEDLHIPGRENFNFSKGWYERFRERLNKYKVKLGVKLEQVKKEEEGDEIKSEDNDSEDQNIKAEGSDCDSVKKEES